MTRAAARKLAKYLRSQGHAVRVRRHALPSGRWYYTVEVEAAP